MILNWRTMLPLFSHCALKFISICANLPNFDKICIESQSSLRFNSIQRQFWNSGETKISRNLCSSLYLEEDLERAAAVPRNGSNDSSQQTNKQTNTKRRPPGERKETWGEKIWTSGTFDLVHFDFRWQPSPRTVFWDWPDDPKMGASTNKCTNSSTSSFLTCPRRCSRFLFTHAGNTVSLSLSFSHSKIPRLSTVNFLPPLVDFRFHLSGLPMEAKRKKGSVSRSFGRCPNSVTWWFLNFLSSYKKGNEVRNEH